MKKMSDDHVRTHWCALKKRQEGETSRAIEMYAVGRTVPQVAALVGYDNSWVREHLQRVAIGAANGGERGYAPLAASGAHTQKALQKVMKDFRPRKPDASYVNDYVTEGHTVDVAECLATAYEAAEKAIEAGVIQESKSKEKQRVTQIVFDPATQWGIELKSLETKMRTVIRKLNDAKITDLRRKATMDSIAKLHAAWMEQVERIENFHPDFDKEVAKHA